MRKYWIAVASKEHVLLGQEQGIIQVCHGKLPALNKIRSGDFVIYYSPTYTFGQKDACQKFTALCKVKDKESYQFKINEKSIPWRKDAEFMSVQDVEIKPLVKELSFIRDKLQWGFMFRFGLFSISHDDFKMIADLMGARIDE